MSRHRLADAEKARAFAKRYTELTTALLREGVPEVRARDEARLAATLIFLAPEHMIPGEKCPLCGRSE